MRKFSYLLVVIGACLFNSCLEEKIPSSKTSAFPDAQVLISDFNVVDNSDGVPELEMTLGEDNRIIGKMDGYVNTLFISREEKDGYVFYTFKEESQSRAYTHISWWGCVTRLASNPTRATIGLVTRDIPLAGALALICLDDKNRWEVNL